MKSPFRFLHHEGARPWSNFCKAVLVIWLVHRIKKHPRITYGAEVNIKQQTQFTLEKVIDGKGSECRENDKGHADAGSGKEKSCMSTITLSLSSG